MRLRPPPLVIDQGFRGSDTFHAKNEGEALAQIVSKIDGPAVIVLDGPWGSGKSTFVKQWAGELKSAGHPVIYWDAFQADHHEDALFPILATLDGIFKKHKIGDGRLLSHARNIVGNVPRALLAGVLEIEALNWKAKVAARVLEVMLDNSNLKRDPARRLFNRRLNRAKEEAKSIEGFRAILEDLVTESVRAPRRGPLVFIIDELDRCNPAFALNVLERIKHVFSSNGICFVLVTHLQELTAIVKHSYGINDAKRYLDKFYQLKVDIESLLSCGDTEVQREYLDYLYDAMNVDVSANHYTDPTLANLAEVHEVSLRTLQRVVLNVALYLEVDRCASISRLTHLAAALCVMRVVSHHMYEEVTTTGLTFVSANKFLRLKSWDLGEDDRHFMEAWWRAVTMEGEAGMEDALAGNVASIRRALADDATDGGTVTGVLDSATVLQKICSDIDLFWQ